MMMTMMMMMMDDVAMAVTPGGVAQWTAHCNGAELSWAVGRGSEQ
jgi:hypothetical protein